MKDINLDAGFIKEQIRRDYEYILRYGDEADKDDAFVSAWFAKRGAIGLVALMRCLMAIVIDDEFAEFKGE